MIPEHIGITTVILKDLYEFAGHVSGCDNPERTVPIALPRAGAQTKNPYARPGDAVLFVAFKDHQVIGYLGRLPGILSVDGKHHRVFWGSTFYLVDKYRGMGIGKRLLDSMISLNQDFVVTRITPQAGKVLRRYGMKVLGSLTYFQFRIERVRFSKGLFNFFEKIDRFLRGKNQVENKWIQIAEETCYRLEKRFFYAAISGLLNKMKGDYQAVFTDKIQDSDFFENQRPRPPFFYRGPELINWMLQEKWVLSRCDPKADSSGYHFSDIRKLFTYIALKLYRKNRHHYCGFVILCLSSGKNKTVLRVLDHSFKTIDAMAAACAFALEYAKRYQADRLEFSEKMAHYLNQNPMFQRCLKKQKREYLYFPMHDKSPLERVRNEIRFDYCDGDTAFT